MLPTPVCRALNDKARGSRVEVHGVPGFQSTPKIVDKSLHMWCLAFMRFAKESVPPESWNVGQYSLYLRGCFQHSHGKRPLSLTCHHPLSVSTAQ